ncbi:DUF7336 domain-containing protein [Paraburkholderia sp. 2C]
MKVYIVEGQVMYEGSTVLRAFASESSARQFKARCLAHDAKRPDYPGVDVTETEWDSYNARFARWETKHPAKSSSFDSYAVYTLTVRP